MNTGHGEKEQIRSRRMQEVTDWRWDATVQGECSSAGRMRQCREDAEVNDVGIQQCREDAEVAAVGM